MVNTYPEAGMFSAYMSYSPENLEIMKQYEKYIRTMLSDEESLINFLSVFLNLRTEITCLL